MPHTSVLLLFFLSLLSLASTACASDAASSIAHLEETVRAATADSPAWEVLTFAPTPRALEDIFLSPASPPAPLWLFAVFVNTSRSTFRRSTDLLRYMLVPAAAAVREAAAAASASASAAPSGPPLAARVLVADLDAARAHFSRHSFAFFLGGADGDGDLPPGREAMLAAVERMIREGRTPGRRQRPDPAEPIALFFRPGAAEHFGGGKGDSGERAARERALLYGTGERAIEEMRVSTLFVREQLAEELVKDYKDTARKVADGVQSAKATMSHEEERMYHKSMAEAMDAIRARREMYRTHPYDMEKMNEMLPKERIATLLSEMRKGHEDAMGNEEDMKEYEEEGKDGKEREEEREKEGEKEKEGKREKEGDADENASSSSSSSTKPLSEDQEEGEEYVHEDL